MALAAMLRDLTAWTAMTLTQALGGPRPPRRALGVVDGAPMLLARGQQGYAPLRPARRGDRAAMLVGAADAVTATASAPAAAALQGADAARFAAEAVCPFAPADAALGHAPTPAAWSDGVARWRVAAAPLRRVQAQAAALRAVGAHPGRPFAMDGEAPIALGPAPRPVAALCVAALCLAVVAGAHAAVAWRADSHAAALDARRVAARAALAQAEAQTARADGDGVLRAARAAEALLAATPDAGAALADFARLLPDDAHAQRVSVTPDAVVADIAAVDAASAAAALGAGGVFASARLEGGAQIDAATGLQRAAVRLERRRAPDSGP